MCGRVSQSRTMESCWEAHGRAALEELLAQRDAVAREMQEAQTLMDALNEQKLTLKGQIQVLRALEKQFGSLAQTTGF